MTFDLRQHIRTILAETDEENLDTLTTLVFDRTPKAATREAYRQALTEVVRRELATAPRASTDSRLDQTGLDTQTTYIEPGHNSAGEGQADLETQARVTLPGGQNLYNSKAAKIRRIMKALRSKGYNASVGVRDKRYVPILECTIEHLEIAASENDHQAEANATAARRYRRLAKLMREREARIVADLSEDDLAGLNDE